ncbi:hypothetical protein QVD17_31291 [Tagetes erecta]|uniref:Uncharacterized protein n=1 Tax=Tagetes erecta TaxID=13708 RepID=A0AAD8K5A4_TARER|nr:hypothetical protein QVD17_31291 [Tagetes erecta]
MHNHSPIENLEGHAYARRLSVEEKRLIGELADQDIPARSIWSALTKKNPEKKDLPLEDEFIDALAEHEYLMFPEDEVAQEKCNKLKKMAVGGHIAIDWTFLDEIAETNRAREIIESEEDDEDNE